MSTLSAPKLKKYLQEYSLHLEYWDPDDGDGNELLGCREILESNKSLLPKEDSDYLDALDDKARSIVNDYSGPDTFDILMLKKTVAIANGKFKKNRLIRINDLKLAPPAMLLNKHLLLPGDTRLIQDYLSHRNIQHTVCATPPPIRRGSKNCGGNTLFF